MSALVNSAQIGTCGVANGTALYNILNADEIGIGTNPSYQVCKDLLVSHPLGGKMCEGPMKMAQSQARQITVQNAPDEVAKEFVKHWGLLQADAHIRNFYKLSRTYGIASLVLGCEGIDASKPIDVKRLWELPIFFNVFDPLNTAGSLVLSQVPNTAEFNAPIRVICNGQDYHRSRWIVMMNEEPVYLAYTGSAFGFVGRSVFQRVLLPMKSYIRIMIADDMIATKLGVIVAKQKQPGSIIDQVMAGVAAIKRWFIKEAQTTNVLSIDVEESIETLDMQNVDGAGTFARTNILKDIATGANMPAKLLENETLVAGFGEGTEDAKTIAAYIDGVRIDVQPAYAWFDNICQYRAWSPPFFERMRKKYPAQYGGVSYEDAFSEWRASFEATWPSLLKEPPAETVKTEAVKLQAVIDVMQVLLPVLDAGNKCLLIESALANMSANKNMFAHEFQVDFDTLLEKLEADDERKSAEAEMALEEPPMPNAPKRISAGGK